jgi:hypothetical protein
MLVVEGDEMERINIDNLTAEDRYAIAINLQAMTDDGLAQYTWNQPSLLSQLIEREKALRVMATVEF